MKLQQEHEQRDPVEELAEQFLDLNRQGGVVTIDDFARRYPRHAPRIRALFPTLLMLETMRPPQPADVTQSVACRDEPPTQIGDFRIVRELGRGGMGIVYEAVQQSLGRTVALKMLSPALLHSPQQVQRFRREARAAARLHHTNIVPVFGSGEFGGVHFYLMQYIAGESVEGLLAADDALLCRRPIRGSWRQIAHVGLQIASALAHAHAQGVCHRDIKPANILLDEQGTAWITDFGLAKAVEYEAMTAPGDAVGTLHYMAPEQLDGRSDARTDVYSLGVTLYELLTWRPAFDEPNRARAVQRILSENPPPPRKLDPSIPRDLETIVLKACAKEPRRRYQTARELALDLERFLSDRPVQARRVSARERVWRWSRRNPALASLTFATLSLLAAVAMLSGAAHVNSNTALSREREQKRVVEQHRQRADRERDRAEANLQLAMTAFDEVCRELAPGQLPKTVRGQNESGSDPPFIPAASFRTTKVLSKLLGFYDEFVAQNGEYDELKQELMRAHRRAGDIQLQLGQYAEAETAYRRALTLHRECCPEHGDVAADAVDEASLRTDLAALLQTTGRFDEARSEYSAVRMAMQQVVDNQPTSAAARYELARALKFAADLAHTEGDRRTAEQLTDDAVGILEGLVAQNPGPPEYRFLLATAEANRRPSELRGGPQYHGRPEQPCPPHGRSAHHGPPKHGPPHHQPSRQALESESRAIRLLEQLAAEFPEEPKYQFELSEVYAQVHLTKPDPHHRHRGIGELFEAESRLYKAIGLCRELVHMYPTVPEYSDALGRMIGDLGKIADELGETEEAETHLVRSVARHEALVERYPNVPDYRDNLASAQFHLGKVRMRQRRHEDARAALEQSVEHRLSFLEIAPENRRGREQLRDQYHDLAETYARLGDQQQAWEVELLARLEDERARVW